MKRLFTIVLLSALCVGSWAQLPMTVVGDMYVGDAANQGKLKSVGPVHLRAFESEMKWARVYTSGIMEMPNVIFYTNDANDGLLETAVDAGAQYKVNAENVTVRMKVKGRTWYQMSLPFDVDLGAGKGGVKKTDGTPMTLTQEYMIQYFDPVARADNGYRKQDGVWASYLWKDAETGTILPKGTGFRFVLAAAGDTEVDFCANTAGTSPDNIAYLFEQQVKGIDLEYKRYPEIAPGTPKFTTPEAEGWNFRGGLHSTNFEISNGTISMGNGLTDKPVYYRNNSALSADDNWIPLNPSAATATLRPYGTLFVQVDEVIAGGETEATALHLTHSSGSGGLVFNAGTSLERETLVLRSAQATKPYDQIGLTLTHVTGQGPVSTFETYFRFGDGFDKLFKNGEDYFVMQTIYKDNNGTEKVSIWSKSKNVDNLTQELFINALPYGENEVPLAVNFPSGTGGYVFSMKEYANETIQNAILVDKYWGRSTDLLKENYVVNSAPGVWGDRFFLYFNRSITSLDPLSLDSEIYAFAENNVLTIMNLIVGDKVQITDLTGRTIASGVASGETFTVTLNQKGVYIVNARGNITLKVLNK